MSDTTAIREELFNSDFLLNSLFFDWYAVGLECSLINFLTILRSRNESEFVDVSEVAPRSGYEQAFEIHVPATPDRSLKSFRLFLMHGGSSVGNRLYLQATGGDAQPFYEYLYSIRHHYILEDAVLIRADVAIDLDEEGVFDQLTDVMTALSSRHRLKRSCLGDWISKNDPKGRTLYLGSRQSPVMARLYEKGKTLIDVRPNLARLELEIKPKRIAARRDYFLRAPSNLVFCNAWGSELFQTLTGCISSETLVKPGTVYRDSDHERAFAHLVKQYRGTIKNQLDILGGDYMLLLHSLLGRDLL